MPSQEQPKLKTTWIKVWVAWGALMFAAVLLAPIFASRVAKSEYARYQACQAGTYKDCRPSMTWIMAGWQVPTTPTPSAASNEAPTTATIPDLRGAHRDSETAPLINSVAPEKVPLSDDGVYHVKPGSKTVIRANVDGAKTVGLYYQWVGSSGEPEKAADFVKTSTGEYTATFTAPTANQLPGSLEVRALNAKGEAASLTLTFAAGL